MDVDMDMDADGVAKEESKELSLEDLDQIEQEQEEPPLTAIQPESTPSYGSDANGLNEPASQSVSASDKEDTNANVALNLISIPIV
ncbi:hypothetical protein VKT23_013564 [Stygiomarasmius scandens]|uniref:Uncharacterized protein n=1 Tax=Marasmiellus scandens TaxID=2682957 RepID=A0ABR1J3B1_9AGAR